MSDRMKNEEYRNNAEIVIVGTGGAGNNTVRYMLEKGITGRYVAVYTTRKLDRSEPNYTGVPIGAETTKGIGAGGDPEIGEKAAEENAAGIREALRGADMVFVTCGMGGGTGTGSAPVIARIAREMGILTVGVVTKPFSFEGGRRMRNALYGIEKLKKETDSLIVISNNRILELVDRRISMADALRISDSVLVQAITGISDIIRENGLMNLDFEDVRTVLKDKGAAYIGIGTASGTDRSLKAVAQAVSSRLLETDITKATDIILYFSGDVELGDVRQAADDIVGLVGEDVNIILGMRYDETVPDVCNITLIAAGTESAGDKKPMTGSKKK